MTKFNVSIGEDFEVSAVDVDTAKDVSTLIEMDTARRENRVRAALTMIIVAFLGMSLLAAFVVGLRVGNFTALSAVWNAGGLPLGFILRSYFDKG